MMILNRKTFGLQALHENIPVLEDWRCYMLSFTHQHERFSSNAICCPNVDSIQSHRLRRWPSIKSTLDQHITNKHFFQIMEASWRMCPNLIKHLSSGHGSVSTVNENH